MSLNYRLDLGAISFGHAMLSFSHGILKDELTLVVHPKHSLQRTRIDVAELEKKTHRAQRRSPFRRRSLSCLRETARAQYAIECPIESIKRFVQMGMAWPSCRACASNGKSNTVDEGSKVRQLNMPRHVYSFAARSTPPTCRQ